ncbi:MAG: Cof-type HAD-IIB family hydrolase [Symbiobacterium sp.]|uniref:Cof-type HAD-IIB family hydrolase n=1 Tax=Symbiobacterium sp. TaxID=1971213 RepID=UPI00346406AD
MAQKRLLALDLDGTLLRSDLTVSPANHAAVARCLREGVYVALCSGRTAGSVERYARLWQGPGLWIISCNGAEIRPAGAPEPLLRRTVPLHLARSVARWAAREGIYLKAYVDGVLLVEKATEETLAFSRTQGVPYVETGDLVGALTGEPTKLVIIADPVLIAQLEPAVRAQWPGELEVTTSGPDSLELTARGVTKGRALQLLAEHLHVDRTAVAAVGNAHNDLSMIHWAGFGGVVRNAPPDVQQAAPVVVGHHDEDGVAEFITAWLAGVRVME